MDAALFGTIVAALAGGGAITAIISTIAQRRKVGADATAVVSAAARELIDPLRKELATERAEHAGEIEQERRKVAQVREELESALTEVRALRRELSETREEMQALRSENERWRRRVQELEREQGRD